MDRGLRANQSVRDMVQPTFGCIQLSPCHLTVCAGAIQPTESKIPSSLSSTLCKLSFRTHMFWLVSAGLIMLWQASNRVAQAVAHNRRCFPPLWLLSPLGRLTLRTMSVQHYALTRRLRFALPDPGRSRHPRTDGILAVLPGLEIAAAKGGTCGEIGRPNAFDAMPFEHGEASHEQSLIHTRMSVVGRCTIPPMHGLVVLRARWGGASFVLGFEHGRACSILV